MENLDTGDTAWMLVSTALVALMIFGLAAFYGGLVKTRHVASTIMLCIGSSAIASLLWQVAGYSLAFGSSQGGLVGGADFAFLAGVGFEPRDGNSVSHLSFMTFQLMFAALTPALIAGAVAERIKVSAFMIFTALWSLLVYAPLAHWVWNPGGWLAKFGALDFAGGTVVHISAGFSAMAAAWIVGKREDETDEPHSLPLAFVGAGMLWIGWFGFNGGSALSAGGLAMLAILNTHLAASVAALAWMCADRARFGKTTLIGALSGAIAGLVAITPAAGFVSPLAACVIGLAGGWIAFLGVRFKNEVGVDDTLDVFGIHGVAGIVGALLTGVFASSAMNIAAVDGLAFGDHSPRLLLCQVVAIAATASLSFVGTLVAMFVAKLLVGLREDY